MPPVNARSRHFAPPPRPSVTEPQQEVRPARTNHWAVDAGLASVWPEVALRLRAHLRRAGVGAADVDDVVQEVALRVVAHGVAFTCADDLLRWCRPVGRRIGVDEHRRRVRTATVDEVPERHDGTDLERAVLARVRTEQVLRAVRDLRPTDQAALVALPSLRADRREQVRVAVRRHRARARLAAIVDGVAGVAGVLGWLVVRRRRPSPALAALAVAPALTGLLLLPSVEAPTDVHVPHDHRGLVVAEVPTTPAPAAAVAAALERSATGDHADGRHPRPGRVRRRLRRIREAAPTVEVLVGAPVPVPVPDLVPDTSVEVAGLEVRLR